MQARDQTSGVDPLYEQDDAYPHAPPQPDPATTPGEAAETRSLVDDLVALVDDARTYLDAELSYQRTRAGFVANKLKTTIAFGAVAAYLAVLATIGLTVGLIIALTPLITAWGATAVVVLALLLIAYFAVRKAAGAYRSMMSAMKSQEEPGDHG